MKKFIIALAFLGMSAVLGNANDTSLMAVGNQLVPIQETDISVKKEVLTLRREGAFISVDVYYEFYNPRDTAKTLLMGFEASAPYPGAHDEKAASLIFKQQPYIKGFTVNVNGEDLKHRIALIPGEYHVDNLKKGTPKYYKNGKVIHFMPKDKNAYLEEHFDYLDLSYVYYFEANFQPGVNIIKHTYRYELSNSAMFEYFFPYSLTPACRWANKQIDDFTLIVDMGDRSSFLIPRTFFGSASEWKIVGAGKKENVSIEIEENSHFASFDIREGYLEFSRKNFRPKGELYVKKVLEFSTAGDEKETVKYYLERGYLDFKSVLSFDPEAYNEMNFTPEDVKIMKNLPFAYRGNIFKTKALQNIYESTDWYIPNPDYVMDLSTLTPEEKKWVMYWSNYKRPE